MYSKPPKAIIRNNELVDKFYCSCSELKKQGYPDTAISCSCTKKVKKQEANE